MNNNKHVINIRNRIYDFLHFDKLACHILSEYYSDCDMVLEFQLDSDNEEVYFQIIGNNLEIIWNNNKSVKYDKIDILTRITNKYEKSGNSIVRIKGELLQFTNCSSNVIKVINWNIYLQNLHRAFFKCKKLEEIPNYIPESVINMSDMFNQCVNLNSDLSKWDVSNVQDMSFMFYYCKKFNHDISKWNVSNVICAIYIFDRCNIREEYIPKI